MDQSPPEPDKVVDKTLDKVLKDFRNSRKYTEGGFWDTWTDSWKLYNGQRVSIGYDGFSDTFVPETYTEIQGIKSHLANGNMEIEFLPTSPDQSGDPQILQETFNYAWLKDSMGIKLDSTLTEYLVTGNCYIWSSAGTDGFPKQKVISARDCFFDPMITNYQDLVEYGYGGYRYITTLDDLKAEMIVNPDYIEPSDQESPAEDANEGADGDGNDPEDATDTEDTPNDNLIPRYKNLDKLGNFNEDDADPTAKQEREDMLADAVLDDTDGQVECILYFSKDKMITVANRSVVIEEVDNPFQRKEKEIQSADDQGQPVSFTVPEIKPFIPVAPFRNLIDPNLWYARGDVEIIGPSQERLNDVQAQKTDNLTFQLNRMWALDPNFAQKLDEIQSVPGAVFTIPPGALEQIPTQPIGADADNEIARIKQEMMAASGSNELIMGQMPSGKKNSMYAINADLILLGARFKVKIANLESEAMSILAHNMWKIMQIFITEETPVRMTGANGVKWSVYNPGLFLGDWDVSVKLGSTADSIKETERQQAMQFYLLASKQPFVDQQSLFTTTAPQIFRGVSVQTAKNLIMPPQPPQTPPNAAAALANNIQFQELYPDEQAEVLSDLGIKPSPYREEQTGISTSPDNPDQIAANMAALHGAGAPHPGGNPPYEKAGMQTAGSAPVGAPTSPTANIPKIPQA